MGSAIERGIVLLKILLQNDVRLVERLVVNFLERQVITGAGREWRVWNLDALDERLMGTRLLALSTAQFAEGKPGFGQAGFFFLDLDVLGERLLCALLVSGGERALRTPPQRFGPLILRQAAR